jgi:hypothetical protein
MGTIDPETRERLRVLLCEMQAAIQRDVITARDQSTFEDRSRIEAVTEADTVYQIDRVSEEAIVAWFEAHWPADLPVRVVMEGVTDEARLVFPPDTSPDAALYTCIIDPIDGTRGLMYDKRSAWILAGVAPSRGGVPTLEDIEVAAMTELPVEKQRRADRLSAVQGCGPEGVHVERVDLDTGSRASFTPRPSRAGDLHHGHVGFSRFFTAGKSLLAEIEEALHTRLYGSDRLAELAIFEDQYICSGGQLYELCMGRDRMIVDLRPLAHRALDLAGAMDCHPYDLCTMLILRELGGVVTSPTGSPLDIPLDTTSSVAWVGYANPELAAHVAPMLGEVLDEYLPATR